MQEYGSLTTDYLASYYSADEKLSLVSRHRGFSSQSDDSRPRARGVWEATRYDALGRRVASYAVRGSACPVSESECASAIERTVWDGAQMLYEIRATHSLSYDGTPSAGTLGAYGRVLYTHGGGIDQPLAVTRLGLEGQPSAVTLSLHAGWQGEFVGATLPSGAPQAGCSGSYGCPQVAAGGRLTVVGVQPNVPPANPAWWGSLTTASGTASGLTYQRNRFYCTACTVTMARGGPHCAWGAGIRYAAGRRRLTACPRAPHPIGRRLGFPAPAPGPTLRRAVWPLRGPAGRPAPPRCHRVGDRPAPPW